MKRWVLPIILVLIIGLGVFLRFYDLGSLPPGHVDDELANGYNAYSLLKTGKDQWNTPWPVTSFRAFGDYRFPAYTYATIPSIAIFGLTPFAIRFPAALFGTLSILVTYYIVRELFIKTGKGSKMIDLSLFRNYGSLFAAFFLSISPWHIGMSRVALEYTMSVFFVVFGLWLFLIGRRKPYAILVSLIILSIGMYTYLLSFLLIPFLVVLVLYVYRTDYRLHKKYVAGSFICALIVLSPFLLSLIRGEVTTRFYQTNVTTNSGIIDLINEKRGSCVNVVPPFLCKLVFNKYASFIKEIINNYIQHFSPNLLLIHGTTTQYMILPERGLLYYSEVILFLIGSIVAYISFPRIFVLLIGWLLFSAVPDSITSDGHYGRFFISMPLWSVMAAIGAVYLITKKRYIYCLILACLLIYETATAAYEYMTFFPYRYSAYSHYGYQQLMHYVHEKRTLYDRIYISGRVNDNKQYIFYIFYEKYNPRIFQEGENILRGMEKDGWIWVRQIENIYFVPSLPLTEVKYLIGQRILLIGSPSEFPKVNTPIQYVVKDKKGDVLFQAVNYDDLERCLIDACP